MALRATC
jgi:hypothetical protein